ncbi:MAG: acyl-CoA dehydrogenase family protein [Deltaproteobacteria bacterium]|nr:acyl-CoA dehydrogenase family protein [Deltaproteobacteria bacterium]MBW2416952.1 acyl-CoA dehydrogenase family protein [Deltaproteobacteria bacterium]
MSDYLNDVVGLYLNELIDWESYFSWRKGEAVDVAAEREALAGVLETAAQICAEFEEATRAGWEEDARLVDGKVVYPAHIADFYAALKESGLISFGVEEQYGGFELPSFIANVIMQMISRADAGMMTIIGLQAGVAEDIQIYGSDELKERYLPGLASGELMGAMDLTEAQAGSDLGAITTRAREEEGRFFLDGEKIFITNGGCELHLVLARDDESYEESKGSTRGLSLYLVPRELQDGSANGVAVTRLEEKLGIHGSPTAAVQYSGAEGWLIGKQGEGFKAMLTLMNNARLGVASQGIGIGEAALASALRYARERVQFGMPIAEQPLMKDKIARMALVLEGSRALLYRACSLIDRNRAIEGALARGGLSEAESVELEEHRSNNDTRIRLLTPLAKYMATEAADSISRDAIQIYGGLGFMAESEVGKLHNDAIITTIYEGTSEIQVSFALKELAKGALTVVFDGLERELERFEDPQLKEFADKVLKGMGLILDASSALLADFNYALMSAQSLAEVVSSVIAGAELLKQAEANPARFDLAASWINRRMADLETRCQRIKEGSADRLDRCEKIIALVK